MALQITRRELIDEWGKAEQSAVRLKKRLQTLIAESSIGPIERHQIIQLLGLTTGLINQITAAGGTSGIQAFLRWWYDDAALDVAAKFTAIVNAATTLRQNIYDGFPHDAGSGNWLVASYTIEGISQEDVFTTAQMSTFRTLAQALVDEIN